MTINNLVNPARVSEVIADGHVAPVPEAVYRSLGSADSFVQTEIEPHHQYLARSSGWLARGAASWVSGAFSDVWQFGKKAAHWAMDSWPSDREFLLRFEKSFQEQKNIKQLHRVAERMAGGARASFYDHLEPRFMTLMTMTLSDVNSWAASCLFEGAFVHATDLQTRDELFEKIKRVAEKGLAEDDLTIVHRVLELLARTFSKSKDVAFKGKVLDVLLDLVNGQERFMTHVSAALMFHRGDWENHHRDRLFDWALEGNRTARSQLGYLLAGRSAHLYTNSRSVFGLLDREFVQKLFVIAREQKHNPLWDMRVASRAEWEERVKIISAFLPDYLSVTKSNGGVNQDLIDVLVANPKDQSFQKIIEYTKDDQTRLNAFLGLLHVYALLDEEQTSPIKMQITLALRRHPELIEFSRAFLEELADMANDAATAEIIDFKPVLNAFAAELQAAVA